MTLVGLVVIVVIVVILFWGFKSVVADQSPVAVIRTGLIVLFSIAFVLFLAQWFGVDTGNLRVR